jgi:hypothetical protein
MENNKKMNTPTKTPITAGIPQVCAVEKSHIV